MANDMLVKEVANISTDVLSGLGKLVSAYKAYEEWLRYRKLGIGGSDAGSICGLNPYSSAIAVFQDKTQKEAGEKEDNEAMRQGRDLEEYVARRFMEETGKKVRRANAIYGHPDHDFMMANVDRLVVGENAGLECKTASAYSADKWKDGHIPESYEIQCHHYMAVTGADAWYIACVVLGKEFIWRKIERDEETIQMLIDIESDFWQNNVKADKMPAPDGSKAAEELLQKYYGSSEPEKMIPLVDFDEKLERRAEISDLQEKLEKEKKQIEQAYLIPYKNKGKLECQFQIGYKGLIDLANRNDNFQTVQARCVYENDVFSYEYGLNPDLHHIPARENKGKLIFVYAMWKTVNGGFGFEVMSKEDIDNHARRFSQSFGSSYSPWKTNYEEMAKKTVIKKCLKYAPLKTDFVMQMSNDESIKSEINVDMSEVVNEQEDPNIIDQEYKEVENEQSEQ